MYIKVKTTFTPAACRIKVAAAMSNRKVAYINTALLDGKLDHGFVDDQGIEDEDKNSKESGAKLVILNAKWEKWLEKQRESDARESKKTVVNQRTAMKELGISKQTEFFKLIRDGDITFTEEGILKDDKYYALKSNVN